jgi:hypothetical protein
MSFSEDKVVRELRPEVTEILQRAADELVAVDPQMVVLAVVMGCVEDGYLVSALAHPAEGWKTETLADVLSRLGNQMSYLSKVN